MLDFLRSKFGFKSGKDKHDVQDDMLHRLSSWRYEDKDGVERLFDHAAEDEAVEPK